MASAQRLLAVTYGGGHVAMVLPVLRQLRNRRPELEIHLLARPQQQNLVLMPSASPNCWRVGQTPRPNWKDAACWMGVAILLWPKTSRLPT